MRVTHRPAHPLPPTPTLPPTPNPVASVHIPFFLDGAATCAYRGRQYIDGSLWDFVFADNSNLLQCDGEACVVDYVSGRRRRGVWGGVPTRSLACPPRPRHTLTSSSWTTSSSALAWIS